MLELLKPLNELSKPSQVQMLHLSSQSVIADLFLHSYEVDSEINGNKVAEIFKHNPTLPGIVLLENSHFFGMISRRYFLEYMSRPYSIELFSKRPIKSLYSFVATEVLILYKNTSIVAALEKCLQRTPELIYEPIVVELESNSYRLLDVHQLLLAHSYIHKLTAQLLNKQMAVQATYVENMARKSDELEIAMASLKTANATLKETQTQLIQLTRREALFKRRLSSQIRDSLDLDTILKTAVNEIHHLLETDYCQFLGYQTGINSGKFELIHEVKSNNISFCQLSRDLTEAIAPVLTNQFALLSQTITSSSLLRLDDISTDSTLNVDSRNLLVSLGLRSLLAVPVMPHAGLPSILLCSHTSVRPWRDEEVELLQDVAEQLAIAINQAKLYEETCLAAAKATAQAKQLAATLQELKQTQSQLIQTEKMSGLGQMVAGVAHEINNPVNFIYGNIKYAQDYIKDLLKLIHLYQKFYPQPEKNIIEFSESIDLDFLIQDLPKLLFSIGLGAERISQIVLSLRNFSRLDEAEMKLVDIHEGIDNTLLILNHRLKPKPGFPEIKVIKNYGSLPLVECYAGQLNQVFMNILVNAIDALETNNNQSIKLEETSQSMTLTIRTQKCEESVLIKIADNGTGMTEEVQRKLFEPFFTTKPVGKGTGLGMSISYKIVEKHRGSLNCSSILGQGTEFCIEIPLRQSS